jgi:hypothetical protein
MRIGLRLLVAVSLGAAALAFSTVASAAPASTSFKLVGYEYAFTSTVGSFAGKAGGDAGDSAAWNAYVKHDRLGSLPTYVNGGSFAMTVRRAGGGLDAVTGALTYHGGTIRTLNRGANCTNQQYLVTAALKDVQTTTTVDGSGQLAVRLTHYRARVLGRCVIYKARVAGTVSFTY